jgi:oligopeptide/dipeptide ABC transporter ATP-binding protein
MAVLLITHDLGVVADMAHRVAVMYAGRVVESASVRDLFAQPKHPYTLGLFRSLPSLEVRGKRLEVIPGAVPSALDYPSGCRFHPRCPLATEQCRREYPPFEMKAAGHWSACWVMK